MSRVQKRRCDICLGVESNSDPRSPWYRVGFRSETYGAIAADVCGACRIMSLADLETNVLRNIESEHIQGVTHTVFTRDM